VINGAGCWDASLQCDMAQRIIGGRERSVFIGMRPSLYHLLLDTAGRQPNSIAIVDDQGRTTSYGRLMRCVDDFAAYLETVAGVRHGGRVGLLMYADLEFVVALFAISKIGAVCVPIPTKYRKPEVVSLMRAADLSAIVAGEEFERWAPAFPLAAPRVVWAHGVKAGYGFEASLGLGCRNHGLGCLEDPAIMMFTSGTTSAAKGVILRNYNVEHAVMVYQRLMGTTARDRCLIPIPIYHVTGLVALLVQFVFVGATVYLHRLFNARRVLECVRDQRITYLHGSPTSFAELLSLRTDFPDLPSVRVMLSGSSYEPVSAMRAFHSWMPAATFKVVYGMTETSSPALLFPGDAPTSIYAGAAGKPVLGVDAKIVDEDGAEVPVGATGELMLSGTCVTEGYYHHDTPDITADGWLCTGDMAYANDEGMVWVVDRKKDMINRGGEKVWCSGLEEVLCEIDGISEACATGIPDDLYGEVPVAAVVRASGSRIVEDEVRRDLESRVAHFEIPTHVIFVDTIPQTRGEKPDRTAVREAVLDSIRKRK